MANKQIKPNKSVTKPKHKGSSNLFFYIPDKPKTYEEELMDELDKLDRLERDREELEHIISKY